MPTPQFYTDLHGLDGYTRMGVTVESWKLKVCACLFTAKQFKSVTVESWKLKVYKV